MKMKLMEHKILISFPLQVIIRYKNHEIAVPTVKLSLHHKPFLLFVFHFERHWFPRFYYSRFVKTNETTARTMLKQVEVQPRPNVYPQKSLAALYFPVKTDIDTRKKIAGKKFFMSVNLRRNNKNNS